MKTLTKNRDEAFELLRLSLQEPRLEQEAMERVKAQILAGLRREAKEPNAIARNAFAAAAFPNHPYGAPLKGTLDGVPRIGRTELETYRSSCFAREGLKIAVVGDIDEKTLLAVLDRVFSDLPASSQLMPVRDVVMMGAQQRRIDLPVPQSVIVFGLPGLARKEQGLRPGRGDQPYSRRRQLHVTALDGGPRKAGPRLFGLFEPLAVQARPDARGSHIDQERARQRMDCRELHQIEAFARGNVTADELNKAKKYLTGSYALRFDTSTKIARELLQAQLDDLGMDYFARRNQEIAAVDAKDIARVAKRLLDTKQMLIVVVGQPVG